MLPKDIKTFFKWKQRKNILDESNESDGVINYILKFQEYNEQLSKSSNKSKETDIPPKRMKHKAKTSIEENQKVDQCRYNPIHGSMSANCGNLEKLFETVDALLDVDTDVHSLLNANEHVFKRNAIEPQWNKIDSVAKVKQNYLKYCNRGDPPLKGKKELPQGKKYCLMGMCFLRTGVLDSLDPNDFNDLIYKYGGRTVKAVSRQINYMVVGTDPGPSKLQKSRSFGIPEISEDDLLDMILTRSGQDARYKMQKEKTTMETEVQTEIFRGINIINQHSHPFCAAYKLVQWLSNWFIYHGLNKPKLERPTRTDNLYSDGAYYKAALLSGERRSSGKTIATQLGFNVMEVKTSDIMNEVVLKEIFGKCYKTGVFPKEKHTLFLDNVDYQINIDAFVTLIKTSLVPIICVCNNPEHPKLKPFVKHCFSLNFYK